VFLVLLPAALAGSLLVPDVPTLPRVVGSLALPAIAAWFFSQIGRDMGYRRQASLWSRWGGSPTVQLLRHRNASTNPEIRRRYHERLRVLEPSLLLPTKEQELGDPLAADHAYDAAARFLIAQTRDRTRFPLIFKENTNYGFRRNLWGMKPVGLPIALLATAGCLALQFLLPATPATPTTGWWVATGVTVTLALFWIFWITPSWVRIPAQAYAERLLEACDQLEPKSR
jgi:hypothetical protein